MPDATADPFSSLQAHANEIAGKTGFDPASIIAIITAIMTAISQFCPKPVPPAALRAGGFGWDVTVNRAMRDNDVRPLSKDGRALHAAITAQAMTLTDADAEAFLSLCQ